MTLRKSGITLFALAMLLLLTGCNLRKVIAGIYAEHIKNAPYDAIIVPGIGFDTLTQQTNGFNARVMWAKTLYDRGVAKNIIFSGAACSTPYVEGKVMKMIAEKLGVPEKHVFCEVKAQHGKENVYYSWLIAHKMGFKKIALATDPYQTLFLKGFVEKNMPEMGILPIAIDSLKFYSPVLPRVDASIALAQDFIPLNKRQNRWSRFEHSTGTRLPDLPEGGL